MTQKFSINEALFKRFSAKHKLEMIERLTPTDLMNITPATITRIVKEAGTRMYKSHDKRLVIDRSRRRGNSWNSQITSVELVKKKLWLGVYFQFENTDTDTEVSLTEFLHNGEYTGSIVREDRYGNDRHYYFTYDEGDKQRVIRSILEEYIYSKYVDKL